MEHGMPPHRKAVKRCNTPTYAFFLPGKILFTSTTTRSTTKPIRRPAIAQDTALVNQAKAGTPSKACSKSCSK